MFSNDELAALVALHRPHAEQYNVGQVWALFYRLKHPLNDVWLVQAVDEQGVTVEHAAGVTVYGRGVLDTLQLCGALHLLDLEIGP